MFLEIGEYAVNLQEKTHVELQSNFIEEITLWHGCSVNLLHIFRTFLKADLGPK